MSTQKVSRLTSTLFTQHRRLKDDNDPEFAFEVHTPHPGPHNRLDTGAHPRKGPSAPSNYLSKHAVVPPRSSRRRVLSDRNGFEELEGGGVEPKLSVDRRLPSASDLRTDGAEGAEGARMTIGASPKT